MRGLVANTKKNETSAGEIEQVCSLRGLYDAHAKKKKCCFKESINVLSQKNRR